MRICPSAPQFGSLAKAVLVYSVIVTDEGWYGTSGTSHE